MNILDTIRDAVRSIMNEIAMFINETTRGAVKPIHITVLSSVMHLVIAAAIVLGSFASAALLLVVFGLMDSLDGALARVQRSVSDRGMIADASSDRLKESILFMAIAYYFADDGRAGLVFASVAALSGSLLTSYIKAKAETIYAVKHSSSSSAAINKVYNDGFLRYEIRMAVLVLGLVLSRLDVAVVVLAVGTFITAGGRFFRTWQKIK